MNACAKFTTIDELKAAMNGWLLGSLWGVQQESGADSWFSESEQVLRTAFGVFCLARHPITPEEPAPIAGAEPPDVFDELRAVSRRVEVWTVQVEDYLDCVRRRSAPHCQASTARDAAALRAATRQLRRAIASPSAEPTLPTTCAAFVAWSTQLFRWSKVFAALEQLIFDCLATDRGLLEPEVLTDESSIDVPMQPRQISPVPWPPWEDIDDT